MLKEHSKLIYRILLLTDISVSILSFFLAYRIRSQYLTHWDLGGLYPLERYTWLLFVIIPAWTLLLTVFEAYRSYRTVSFIDELMAIGKAVIVGGLIIGAIAFAMKSQYLSRAFILTFVIVNFLLLGIERFTIRAAAWMVRKRGYNFRNVVVVGTGAIARDFVRRIESYGSWGLRILGYVSEKNTIGEYNIEGHQVIGTLAELEDIIKRMPVDDVIVAVSETKLEELEETFLMLEDHGINARMIANIFPHIIAKVRLEELESIPLLTFSTVPTDMLALAVKRANDIILSILLLILSLPIMIVTSIILKATSAGPVMFKQKRAGLRGRIFTLYKFRSMNIDAESRKEELEELNEMTGPVFKISNDPRVTRIGRIIRKTSIDELPQLWNVLRGDMSIVGPRPPIPAEIAQYERWQWRRLSMRPGLTCLWQVSGRNKINDFSEWVKLDLQYIDTWSLALDLKIFLRTIPVVLFRKGAA